MTHLKLLIAFAFVLFVTVAHAPAAHANCMEECLGRHDCDGDYLNGKIKNEDNQCRIYLDDCQDECMDANNNANIFGALAFDQKTKAYALSEPAVDKDSAAQNALALCQAKGATCKIVANYTNTCVSVAVGKNNTVAWAEGGALDNAQDSARDDCADKHGGKCTIQQSHCYFP